MKKGNMLPKAVLEKIFRTLLKLPTNQRGMTGKIWGGWVGRLDDTNCDEMWGGVRWVGLLSMVGLSPFQHRKTWGEVRWIGLSWGRNQ